MSIIQEFGFDVITVMWKDHLLFSHRKKLICIEFKYNFLSYF